MYTCVSVCVCMRMFCMLVSVYKGVCGKIHVVYGKDLGRLLFHLITYKVKKGMSE